MKSILFGALLVTVAGCGAPPTANVSDMAVFTSLHVLAAEMSTDAEENAGGSPTVGLSSGPFTAAHMRRYFESTTQNYVPERMDAMLDGQQRQTAYAQALERSLALNVAANFTPTAGAGGGTSSSTATSSSSSTSGGSSMSVATTQMTATTAPTQFVQDQVTALKSLLDQASGSVV